MKGTTKSNGQKDLLDRFYTKESIALKCIKLVDLECFDTIIEPSAGGGSFSKNIEGCYAYDINPADESITKADWFTLDKSQFTGNILVIGNPPFGQQNSLSVNFFNESAKFANVIAFILPKSFKKDSVKNRLDLNFSLVKELDLPEDSFVLLDEEKSVPCVFQIWERTKEPRKKVRLKTTTSLFSFVAKDGDADFRVQRVGGNAGKASFNLDYAASSNYFIKNTSDIPNEEFVEVINNLIFPSIEFTVGPKSLSKGELIAILEEELLL